MPSARVYISEQQREAWAQHGGDLLAQGNSCMVRLGDQHLDCPPKGVCGLPQPEGEPTTENLPSNSSALHKKSPDFVSPLFGNLSLEITATGSHSMRARKQTPRELALQPACCSQRGCAPVPSATIKHLHCSALGTCSFGPAAGARHHAASPAKPGCVLLCTLAVFFPFFFCRRNAKFELFLSPQGFLGPRTNPDI